MSDQIEHYPSSGNVFADLGFDDPELELAKADLAIRIWTILKERKLSQRAAAKILGVAQPDISRIVRGDLEDFSIERLMRLLIKFDQEIEITVRPAEHGRYIVKDPVATAAD